MKLLLAAIALALSCCAAPTKQSYTGTTQPQENQWTVLVYGAVDNDWERPFMQDLKGMLRGLDGVRGMETLLLIDRAPGYSRNAKTLLSEFEDTRLFRLTDGDVQPLSGKAHFPGITENTGVEMDLSDASTLRDFIRYGKEHYPAKHYAIWFVSHGEGPYSCPDETDGGDLFTAEISDVLKESDSVDILGFDACLMASAENAYQWRKRPGEFGADLFIAAAPVSSSWPYEELFLGLQSDRSDTDASAAADSHTALSPTAFANYIVGTLRTQITEGKSGDRGLELDLQSWGAFSTAGTEVAKIDLDRLAKQLWLDDAKGETLALRGSGLEAETFVYVWPEPEAELYMPFVDWVHICERIAASDDFSKDARRLAKVAATSARKVVTASFGMAHYKGFTEGAHGLYLVFPEGDSITEEGASYWSQMPWYSPLSTERAEATNPTDSPSYGSYAWCIDGAVPGNQEVDNWFELMDAWFDTESMTLPGGVNRYSF